MKYAFLSIPLALALAPAVRAQIQFDTFDPVHTGDYPKDVAAADLDGDGDLDLVAALRSPPRLAVLKKTVGGKFESPVYEPVVGARDIGGIAAVDLDGDLRPDVAVLGHDTNDLWVFHNLGNAHLVQIARIPLGAGPKELEANDLDGDGDLDFLVSNELGDSLSVVINDGSGFFSARPELPIGITPKGLAVGCFAFTRGLLRLGDVAIAEHDSHSIHVLHNTGNANFVTAAILSVPSNSHPEGLVVRDLDGDGLDDIAACYSGATLNRVAIFYREGSGFSAPALYNIGSEHPTHMVADDFDRDGRIDLAFVSPQSLHVTVVRQRELREFEWSGMWDVAGPGSDHLVSGDFDASGYPDLVATNDGGNTLTVLYNALGNPLTYCYGAPNSVGLGATLDWSGAPSVTGEFVLTVQGAPGGKLGTFLYGPTAALVPYRSGYLCLAPPIVRLGPPLVTFDDGTAKRVLDFSSAPVGSGESAITVGSAWNFQFWYRDTLPTGGATSNFTNGVRGIFLP